MKRFSMVTLVSGILFLVLLSDQNGPSASVTGAPGDSGNCTVSGCHSIANNCRLSLNSDSITVVFGNNVTSYKNDSTYTIALKIGTSNNKAYSGRVAGYGFQGSSKMITGAGSSNVGTFIASTGQKIRTNGYIEHGSVRSGSIANGHIFTFQWKAPSSATYKDSVKFYFSTNEAYNNGSFDKLNDSIRTKMIVIACDTTSSTPITSALSAPLQEKLSVQVMQEKLLVTQTCIDKSFVIVSIGGQIVSSGKAAQTIDLARLTPGIYYFISENRVARFYKQ